MTAAPIIPSTSGKFAKVISSLASSDDDLISDSNPLAVGIKGTRPMTSRGNMGMTLCI